MDMVQLMVAKGWAEIGIVLDTISVALANVRTVIDQRPMTGYTHAIIYKLVPLIPQPYDAGLPSVTVGSVTTSDQNAYSGVATYDVSDGRNASISEVMLDTNNWAGTQWRLIISGTVMFTAQVFNSAPSFSWRQPNQIPTVDSAGATDRRGRVRVEARSAAGASITAYAAITAKEYALRVFTLDLVKSGGVAGTAIHLSGNLLVNGIDLWTYISSEDPLRYVVTNLGGLSGEEFAVQTLMLNTDRAKIDLIKKFMQEYGMTTVAPIIQPGQPLVFQ